MFVSPGQGDPDQGVQRAGGEILYNGRQKTSRTDFLYHMHC